MIFNSRKEQEILFHSGNKYFIPLNENSEITVKTAQLSLSLNKELSRYGYSLSFDALNSLMHQSEHNIIIIHNMLLKILDNETGYSDFKSSEPFYPNFPEEVMSKSDAELYFNASLYYLFSQTDNKIYTEIAQDIRKVLTDSKTIERPTDETDLKNLKIISLAKENELEEILYSRIMAPAMSKQQFVDLETYISEEMDWKANIFGDEIKDGSFDIPSHETRGKLALLGYKYNDKDFMNLVLKNAEDVLRFAAELTAYKYPNRSWMNASLNFPIKKQKCLFKFSTTDKKLIARQLERCPDLFTSIWHRPDMFEKLKNRLNVNDTRSLPRVTRAFSNLSNHQKLDEFDNEIVAFSDLEMREACRQGDINTFRAYMEAEPNKFLRNIVNLFESIEQGNAYDRVQMFIDVIDPSFFAKQQKGFTAVEFFKLGKFIETLDAEKDPFKVNYIAKSHNYYVRENEDYLSSDTKLALADKMKTIATMRLNATKELYADKTIYIDPELSNRNLPLRTLRNSSDRVTMTPFSIRNLSADTNLLTAGIFWKNQGNCRCDIDLSMFGYDKNNELVSHIWYSHLTDRRGDKVLGVHSGDYTSGEIAKDINGAVEYIMVDKNVLKEKGVHKIVFTINGFNQPLDKVDDLRMIFSELSGDLNTTNFSNYYNHTHAPAFNGEIMDPVKMDLSYSLSCPDRSCISYMIDVDKDKLIFLDQPYTNVQMNEAAVAMSTQSMNVLQTVMYLAEHNNTPSIKEFADLLQDKDYNIHITDQKEDADVIFSADPIDTENLKEDMEIITSYEFDKLASLLCDPRIDVSKTKDMSLERQFKKHLVCDIER